MHIIKLTNSFDGKAVLINMDNVVAARRVPADNPASGAKEITEINTVNGLYYVYEDLLDITLLIDL